MKKIPIEILIGCYPYLFNDCIYHAINALEQGKITSMQLGAYLNAMNEYFMINGNLEYHSMGLVPLDRQKFYDKKLSEWLKFWEIDENSIVGAIAHNAKVMPVIANGEI